jgi:hypothetical protein
LIAVRFTSLVLLAVVGCKASNQLGEECALVKRDPNVDGGRLYVRNGELKVAAMKDFISFGSTDCEDLICVRDADYAPPDGGALQPNETAKGYCSKSCINESSCSSPELDGNPQRRLKCRPLLLDAETLRALCNGSDRDRARCKTAFGSTTGSDYCARGAVDAGI